MAPRPGPAAGVRPGRPARLTPTSPAVARGPPAPAGGPPPTVSRQEAEAQLMLPGHRRDPQPRFGGVGDGHVVDPRTVGTQRQPRCRDGRINICRRRWTHLAGRVQGSSQPTPAERPTRPDRACACTGETAGRAPTWGQVRGPYWAVGHVCSSAVTGRCAVEFSPQDRLVGDERHLHLGMLGVPARLARGSCGCTACAGSRALSEARACG